MKTLALDQAGQVVAEALKQQSREEPILLTKGSDALGLLLRLPDGTKDSDVDGAFWLDGPAGQVLVIVQAKFGSQLERDVPGRPVFGSCKGMLTVVSEDDEHLKDFKEYME